MPGRQGSPQRSQRAQRREVNRGRGVAIGAPEYGVARKATAQRKGAKTPGRKGRKGEGGVVRGGPQESAGLEGGVHREDAKGARAREGGLMDSVSFVVNRDPWLP